MIMPKTKERETSLSLGLQAASPFGCCNFFDSCTDEILGLHFSGRLGLLDWMGFDVTDECYRSVEFINYVRPQRVAGGGASAGYLSDPCADPNGISFGSCKLTVEDFGRIGRAGPTREVMVPKKYCKTSPRRRLDGSLVTDEREWDMVFTMETMLSDLYSLTVIGNASTGGQFDGLENWVKTGYSCKMLDSTVINWNANNMDGGAGITWNGAAVAPTYNFVDVLLSAYRKVVQRLSWAKVMSIQQPRVGDMILVMPTFLKDCFLDAYTCWSVCPGQQYSEANINTIEGRQFRDRLLGGLFGQGRIFLDSFEIPIMTYDWELIKGPTLGDIYLLTGSWGNQRIWEGQHLDANEAARNFGDNGFFSTDGGRVLGKLVTDNECYRTKLWMHPRLFCLAPWAQVRFQNVACHTPGGPLSPDPDASSFYPESSFIPANCP